jgi:hypothetical protein
MSGQFSTVLARDLELLGAVRMKIVSYYRRRSGRVYYQRGFEAKRRFRFKWSSIGASGTFLAPGMCFRQLIR